MKQPKKSHAQIKREVDAILRGKPLSGKPLSRGHAGPHAQGVTPGDKDVARAVHRVIREIDATGRFGPEKVFISEIWARLSRQPGFGRMTESDFKRTLLRLNRSRLIDLARADLVGAMNRQQVRASEIEDLGNTFHFVLDPHASFSY